MRASLIYRSSINVLDKVSGNGYGREMNEEHLGLGNGLRSAGCYDGLSAFAKATARLAAVRRSGERENMPFCETKPFVMLKELHLYGSERNSCIDYRKMTNGFVF